MLPSTNYIRTYACTTYDHVPEKYKTAVIKPLLTRNLDFSFCIWQQASTLVFGLHFMYAVL